MTDSEPHKQKRVMTPEQLEKLAEARKKALATRQLNAENKKLERQKEFEKSVLEKVVKEKERDLKVSNLKKKIFPITEESFSDDSYSSDSQIEERIIKKKVVNKKKKKAPRVIYKYESDSSDSESEIVIKRRRGKKGGSGGSGGSVPSSVQSVSGSESASAPFIKPINDIYTPTPEERYKEALRNERIRLIRQIVPNYG